MRPPYLKIIYQHRSIDHRQVLYVGQGGAETDISDVVQNISVEIGLSDLSIVTLSSTFPVVQVLDDGAILGLD